MIKFFRNIRQNLLSEGRTGKYLKYAIGEIVLVMIGILLALQINNWNTARKNNQLQLEYLKGIQNNLKEDKAELNKLFKGDTLKLDAYTYFMKADLKTVSVSEQELIPMIYSALGTYWFEGQNVVFSNLTSSGDLNLIQSESIRIQIQKYYRLFVETEKQESWHNDQILALLKSLPNSINLYTFIEPTFEKRWQSYSGNPNISNFSFEELNELTSIRLDTYSNIKALIWASHLARLRLYQQGEILEKQIEDYLIDHH